VLRLRGAGSPLGLALCLACGIVLLGWGALPEALSLAPPESEGELGWGGWVEARVSRRRSDPPHFSFTPTSAHDGPTHISFLNTTSDRDVPTIYLVVPLRGGGGSDSPSEASDCEPDTGDEDPGLVDRVWAELHPELGHKKQKKQKNRSAQYKKKKNTKRHKAYKKKRAAKRRTAQNRRAAEEADPTGNTARANAEYLAEVHASRTLRLLKVRKPKATGVTHLDASEQGTARALAHTKITMNGKTITPGTRKQAEGMERSRSTLVRYHQKKKAEEQKKCPNKKSEEEKGKCGRPGPSEAQANRLAVVHTALRKRLGKKLIPTYITDAMGASCFPFGQTCARKYLKGKTGRTWQPTRVMPPLRSGEPQKRTEFSLQYGGRPESFWQHDVIFADCKRFQVRTSPRQKVLGRWRRYYATYRTRREGLLRHLTRPSGYAAKGSSKSVGVYAAVARGEVLLWEEYTAWNAQVAAAMTRKLEQAVRDRWPEEFSEQAGVGGMHLVHDNDFSFNSALNRDQESSSGFRVIHLPPRSPEFMPLDYAHWAHILTRMQAAEAFSPQSERAVAYKARLRATALATPPDVINRAHGQMVDHLAKVEAAKGCHFEDGRRATNELKNMKKRKWTPAQLDAEYQGWKDDKGGWLRTVERSLRRQEEQEKREKEKSGETADPLSTSKPQKKPEEKSGETADPPSKPQKKPKEESTEAGYQRRWAHEAPQDPRTLLVNAGMYASGQENACLWLSTLVALSRVPESQWPLVGVNSFWDHLREDLRAIRATPARDLRWAKRSMQASWDTLGQAASWLRTTVGTWMLTQAGRAESAPFWVDEHGPFISGPGGPALNRHPDPARVVILGDQIFERVAVTWAEYVQGSMVDQDAEEQHVQALAFLLGIRIRPVHRGPNGQALYLAHVGSQHAPFAEIVLANNGAHFEAFVQPDRARAPAASQSRDLV
jgi:hypothetical protein